MEDKRKGKKQIRRTEQTEQNFLEDPTKAVLWGVAMGLAMNSDNSSAATVDSSVADSSSDFSDGGGDFGGGGASGDF